MLNSATSCRMVPSEATTSQRISTRPAVPAEKLALEIAPTEVIPETVTLPFLTVKFLVAMVAAPSLEVQSMPLMKFSPVYLSGQDTLSIVDIFASVDSVLVGSG